MELTSDELRKDELFRLIYDEGIADPFEEEMAVREYRELVREECIQIGEHFKMILPSRGNDLCLNCGETS